MRIRACIIVLIAAVVAVAAAPPPCAVAQQPAAPRVESPANTWVKHTPLPGSPVSPRMGYETSMGYDPIARRVVRFAGHNQGGGGEQNAELWTFDPLTAAWKLMEPNTRPPGACCNQQNVFDLAQNRFIRFPAFSGSHGWQWFRNIYLRNTSVWNYDLASNTWRDMRPLPEPRVHPLRCAAWDSDHDVVVVFGGEGSHEGTLVYDPYVNRWTRMNPPVEPEPRSGGNMTYDAAHKLHILFGAQFTDDRHTWAYDLRANRWRDMQPPVQPPTNRNDPVLAYDSANRVVVALVRAVEKQDDHGEPTAGHLETWTYDAGVNRWKKLDTAAPDTSWGSRRRVMIYVPDQNVCLLESHDRPDPQRNKERQQQVWTLRLSPPAAAADAPPAPLPLPPTDVKVTTHAKGADGAASAGAVLAWKRPARSSGAEATGYAIYRVSGAQPWRLDEKLIARIDAAQTRFADTNLLSGQVYHYSLRAIDAAGRQGPSCTRVRTQPRVVQDAVVSVLSVQDVRLTWQAPPGADIVGYQIERADVEVFSNDQLVRVKQNTPLLDSPSVGGIKAIGPFVRLTTEPINQRVYTDSSVDLSAPKAVAGEAIYRHHFYKDQLDPDGKAYRFAVYAYRIRAVNALGVEGGDSPAFLSIASAPTFVFAREDGQACHLKWAANPEQALAGYRVYRMNGRWVPEGSVFVQRLTADPIRANTFTDPEAGKNSRRYYIVAVDAIGQEGLPSAPAWHDRQWQPFYTPFVGQWHQ